MFDGFISMFIIPKTENGLGQISNPKKLFFDTNYGKVGLNHGKNILS
jgi:hypothetical protein